MFPATFRIALNTIYPADFLRHDRFASLTRNITLFASQAKARRGPFQDPAQPRILKNYSRFREINATSRVHLRVSPRR